MNTRRTASGPGPTRTDPVRFRGVSKRYRSGRHVGWALAGIDLDLEPHTFTAVMGPSGSGKTTLLNCLLGLEKPDAGSIHLGDVDVTRLDETRLAELRRSRLGVVFQSYNLLPALTAADNISLPWRLADAPIDPRLVQQAADAVEVGDLLDRRPTHLSGGEQQRVAIARALITNPEIVVADEPTGALDTASAATVLDLLRRIVGELGQRVLMVTHDPVAASAADRIFFLADGQAQGELHDASPGQIAAALSELGRR